MAFAELVVLEREGGKRERDAGEAGGHREGSEASRLPLLHPATRNGGEARRYVEALEDITGVRLQEAESKTKGNSEGSPQQRHTPEQGEK